MFAGLFYLLYIRICEIGKFEHMADFHCSLFSYFNCYKNFWTPKFGNYNSWYWVTTLPNLAVWGMCTLFQSNIFHFHRVFGKNLQNNRLVHPLWLENPGSATVKRGNPMVMFKPFLLRPQCTLDPSPAPTTAPPPLCTRTPSSRLWLWHLDIKHLWLASWRLTSYWNAFLLYMYLLYKSNMILKQTHYQYQVPEILYFFYWWAWSYQPVPGTRSACQFEFDPWK